MYIKISFYNDSGATGVLRGEMNLPATAASCGSKVRVRPGGPFYDVIKVLVSENGTTLDLGDHNLSPATVRGLQARGFSLRSR